MNIDVFRRKIVAGAYELTQHGKDEAANDDLDIEDVEAVVLSGKVVRMLTKRYVIRGLTREKQEVEIVCRILPSGRMRIITVYRKR